MTEQYYRLIQDLDGSYKFVPFEPRIMNYTIEEVMTILNGLEIERILDIKMTMDNLKTLGEKIQEDFQNTINNVYENMNKPEKYNLDKE